MNGVKVKSVRQLQAEQGCVWQEDDAPVIWRDATRTWDRSYRTLAEYEAAKAAGTERQ